MSRHDLHQHLWPEPLLAALARRRTAPRMRCDAAGRRMVELRGEPVCEVDLRAHDPAGRAALAERGEHFTFSAADIHRVSHHPGEPAVTLHAYSPPLWRMGAYEILPDGGLRRHSMSYAEELRPL